jgi:soluble lytic murein transglycosylase-like protein
MFSNFGIPEFTSQEAKYQNIIDGAAETFNVDSRIISAIISTESSWDQNIKRYEPKLNTYSLGLMQLLPSTAKSVMGNQNLTDAQILDPYTNIMAGTKYYSQQLQKYGDPILAYAAYNAGSVRRNSDGSLVNAGNVNNFTSWYRKYIPSNAPAPIIPAPSIIASVLPAGASPILYMGVSAGIIVVAGILYYAGKTPFR